jgi:hypothetical protein
MRYTTKDGSVSCSDSERKAIRLAKRELFLRGTDRNQ